MAGPKCHRSDPVGKGTKRHKRLYRTVCGINVSQKTTLSPSLNVPVVVEVIELGISHRHRVREADSRPVLNVDYSQRTVSHLRNDDLRFLDFLGCSHAVDYKVRTVQKPHGIAILFGSPPILLDDLKSEVRFPSPADSEGLAGAMVAANREQCSSYLSPARRLYLRGSRCRCW